MLTLFTALEARAIAYLRSPEDFSIYTHIEVRILDSVQHGATHLLYAGAINEHVIGALRALGYEVTRLQYESNEVMIKIDWTNIMCPDSLVCPKGVNNGNRNTINSE